MFSRLQVFVVFVFGMFFGGTCLYLLELSAYTSLMQTAHEASARGESLVVLDITNENRNPLLLNEVAYVTLSKEPRPSAYQAGVDKSQPEETDVVEDVSIVIKKLKPTQTTVISLDGSITPVFEAFAETESTAEDGSTKTKEWLFVAFFKKLPVGFDVPEVETALSEELVLAKN